jgi:hypothetical protein
MAGVTGFMEFIEEGPPIQDDEILDLALLFAHIASCIFENQFHISELVSA